MVLITIKGSQRCMAKEQVFSQFKSNNSYRPVIFNKDSAQSMLKTLSTVMKASHHQAQIDTKLLEINYKNEPINIGALENIISNYYNGVINCLLPPFLVHFESPGST